MIMTFRIISYDAGLYSTQTYVYICIPKGGSEEKNIKVFTSYREAKKYQNKKYKKGDWAYAAEWFEIIKRKLL